MAEINQNVGTTATDPLHRGTDYRLRISVVEADDSVVDLNAVQSIVYTLHGVAPSKDPDAPALITKSVGSGVSVTDASGGVFEVDVLKDDTLPLWPGKYYHQVMLVNSLGRTYKPLSGTAQLTQRF